MFVLLASAMVGTIIVGGMGGKEDTEDVYGTALKLYEEGKFKESLRKIEKDNTFKGYNLKGNNYMNLGEENKAIEEYNKGLKKDSVSVHLLLNRGNAYFHMKDYKKAQEDFKKVIELDPENSIAYLNMGSVYAHQEKYFESLDMLEKAKEYGNVEADEYIDNVNKMSQEHLNTLYEKGELDVIDRDKDSN